MVVGFFQHAAAGVARIADHVVHHLGLRVVLPFDECGVDRVESHFFSRLSDFALVEDGVVALEADRLAMHAEDALRDAVEGAAPELVLFDAGQVLHTFQHFLGGLVGKGEQQDFVRVVCLGAIR